MIIPPPQTPLPGPLNRLEMRSGSSQTCLPAPPSGVLDSVSWSLAEHVSNRFKGPGKGVRGGGRINKAPGVSGLHQGSLRVLCSWLLVLGSSCLLFVFVLCHIAPGFCSLFFVLDLSSLFSVLVLCSLLFDPGSLIFVPCFWLFVFGSSFVFLILCSRFLILGSFSLFLVFFLGFLLT